MTIGFESPSVYLDDVLPPDGVEAVSPPREGRSTDLTNTYLTLPVVIAIVTSILTGVTSAGVAGWAFSAGIRDSISATQSDIRDIRTSMAYEKELRSKDDQLLEERFARLSAEIVSAGLRNFNMSQAKELQELKGSR